MDSRCLLSPSVVDKLCRAGVSLVLPILLICLEKINFQKQIAIKDRIEEAMNYQTPIALINTKNSHFLFISIYFLYLVSAQQ